ncbi:MAG: hypothetical protein AAFZ89_10105 [Bacteroidota bacterium]
MSTFLGLVLLSFPLFITFERNQMTAWMRKLKMKWNSERILSLSAMGISFITLIIFIYQTNLMSRQNYLSILPYVSISTTENRAEHTFELNLENYGVGPAIIESVTMLYDNKRYDLEDYDNEIYKFLVSKAPELDSLKSVSSSTLNKGMALPVNITYNALAIIKSPSDYTLITTRLDSLVKKGLDYELIYRSIQNERWSINNDAQGPRKLD